MIDRTTKTTLIAIAAGLWANALIPILAPHRAQAQDDDTATEISNMASAISDMADDVHDIASDVSDIKDGVTDIGDDTSAIAGGTCNNDSLCK